MIPLYEEPAKAQLRAAAQIAIDQAGFTLVDEPVKVELPSDLRMHGSLVGDLQSLDGSGKRTFYYLRPRADQAVPKWIANLARASHACGAGAVYVVCPEYSESMVASCTDVGAGLLRLSDSGVFEMVVDYFETTPRSLEEAIERRLTEIRRLMERKIDMARTDIEARFGQSAAIIAEMEGEAGDRYVGKFDAEYRMLEEWGASVSRRLDSLGSQAAADEIAEVERIVNLGPTSARSPAGED